jgi:hypothetical protein
VSKRRATAFPGVDAYQSLKMASESITDAVYAAIADLEDGTDAQLIAYASKRCGKKITPAQFKRALKECSKRG